VPLARKPRVLRALAPAPQSRGTQTANWVRDPKFTICSYPRLGEARDVGCSSRGGLRGCRRRNRAHSRTNLIADLSGTEVVAPLGVLGDPGCGMTVVAGSCEGIPDRNKAARHDLRLV
jgi:hypothetical protein